MAIDMVALLATQVKETTEEANALGVKIGEMTTDRTKAIHDLLTADETKDETIAKWQAYREAALASIAEAEATLEAEEAKAYAYAESTLPAQDADKVVADIAAHKVLVEQVKSALVYAKKIPGYTEEAFKDVPALKNLRGKDTGKGGSKRPRIERAAFRVGTKAAWTEAKTTKTEDDGTEVDVTNFTVLALALKDAFKTKVEVKELQAAAFEAAGTDDLSSLDGKVFDFAHSVGDNTVFIQIQPKKPTVAAE